MTPLLLNPAEKAPASAAIVERRQEPRQAVRNACHVWLIDHYGSTMLRGECRDVSKKGMRLRVPRGYGVMPGQRYELCPQLPGEKSAPDCGILDKNRWITVVRAEIRDDEDENRLDIGVMFDPADATKSISKATPGLASGRV